MSITIEALYQRNDALLKKAGVDYREVEHEPVFSYEAAEKVREQFHLTGAESKSLFLKLKNGRYCMFITLQDSRLNAKKLKQLLGSKPSICDNDTLIEQTGCLPKCACPFGHSNDITLVVDRAIFNTEKLIFSPGPAERSIEIDSSQLPVILTHCDNEIIYYES